MAKNKPTVIELRNLFTEMMLNGYYHLQCIDKEILSLDIKNLADATEEQKNKIHALTMTFVLINDLLHQGHKASKQLLKKEYHPLIDSYMRRHKTSIEQNLVDQCKCIACGVSDEAEKSEETKS